MRYYNFLVDFLFYAGAALNFIFAILYFAGTVSFKLDKSIDILYALYCIAYGIFAIAIRNRLVNFKKEGLGWFRISRYITIGTAFITMIVNLSKLDGIASYLLSEEMKAYYTLIYLLSFAGSLGIALAELSYFKKREELFIN